MTNRYQKEIEEILKKAGESPAEPPVAADEPPPEPLPRRIVASAPRGGAFRPASISYKHLLLAGVAVLVVSIFFGGLPVFLIGAALLVGGYIVYYRAPQPSKSGRNSGGRPPKMWRGRTIDPGDDPHFTDDPWGRGRR